MSLAAKVRARIMTQEQAPPPAAKRKFADTTPSNHQSSRKRLEDLQIRWRPKSDASPDSVPWQDQREDDYWVKVRRSLHVAFSQSYKTESEFEKRLLVSFRGRNRRRQKTAVHVWVGGDIFTQMEVWWIKGSDLCVGCQLPCGADDALVLSRRSRCDIVFCRAEENNIVSPVAMIELKLGREGPGVKQRDDCGLDDADGPICQQVMYMLHSVARTARWCGRRSPLRTAVITGLEHGSGAKFEHSTSVSFSLVPPSAVGHQWALDFHDQFSCDRSQEVKQYVEKCKQTMFAVIQHALEMSRSEMAAPLGMLGSVPGATLVAAPQYGTEVTISQGELHKIVDLVAFHANVKGWEEEAGAFDTDEKAKHVQRGDLVKVFGSSFYIPVVGINPTSLQLFQLLGKTLDKGTLRCVITLPTVCMAVMPEHPQKVDPIEVMCNKADRKRFLEEIYQKIFLQLLDQQTVYLDMRPSLRNVCRDDEGAFKLVDLDSFCKGLRAVEAALRSIPDVDGRYPPPNLSLPAVVIVQLLHVHFCASRKVAEAELLRFGKGLWRPATTEQTELRKKFDKYVSDLDLHEVVHKVREEPSQKCEGSDLESVVRCLSNLDESLSAAAAKSE